MTMIEIWIPEALIVFFLALPLFRSFIKALWPLDGLVWLPLIALVITVGLFPAYGFRPECLPILVFALFYNFANLFPLILSAASRSNDSFRDKKFLPILCTFILLSIAAFPMFAFPSRVYIKSAEEAETVKVLEINNRIINSAGVFNREYAVRVYGAVQESQPLIFLVPPEIGSADSVDIICTELRKKDFTVVTYSYRDYNRVVRKLEVSEQLPLENAFLQAESRKNAGLERQPTGLSNKSNIIQGKNNNRNFISPAELLTHWRVFNRGANFVSANEQGKTLEAQRRTEIEFLLSRLPALLNDPRNGNLPPILLVGYGTGASALSYLAGEGDLLLHYGNVLGVVAIESRLWSSYLPEDRKALIFPAYAGIITRQWQRIVYGFNSLLPQKVSRTGPLPGAGLPVLYLVSGKALDTFKGQKPYQAVFDSLHSGSEPLVRVALAAIEEAGPLDYQDYPFTHPVYSVLLPGLKNAEKSAVPLVRDPIDDTTGIISNFAFYLLEQAEKAEAEDPGTDQKYVSRETIRYPIGGKLYVESRGLPGFGL